MRQFIISLETKFKKNELKSNPFRIQIFLSSIDSIIEEPKIKTALAIQLVARNTELKIVAM